MWLQKSDTETTVHICTENHSTDKHSNAFIIPLENWEEHDANQKLLLASHDTTCIVYTFKTNKMWSLQWNGPEFQIGLMKLTGFLEVLRTSNYSTSKSQNQQKAAAANKRANSWCWIIKLPLNPDCLVFHFARSWKTAWQGEKVQRSQ